MCRKTNWTSPTAWCSSSLRSIPIRSPPRGNTSSTFEGRSRPCAHCPPQGDYQGRSRLDLTLCSSPFLWRSQETIPIWFCRGLCWRRVVHLWFFHLPIGNTHPQGLRTSQSISQCRSPQCSGTLASNRQSGCMVCCRLPDRCISAMLTK